MKTTLILLFALSLSAAVPRHIIERTPLEERNGKVTFVDKYSDGTIDRVDVPQTIKLENKEYSVATNVSRVVCIGVVRTNAMWCMAYEVRSVDGSVKTNLNYTPVDRQEVQRERKASLTNLSAMAKEARAKDKSRVNAKPKAQIKSNATAQIAAEAHRVTMLPADPVATQIVNNKGQLVQIMANGQTRIKDLPRRASVPIAPAKKTPVEPDNAGAGTAAATGAAGVIAGAAGVAALKRKK